MPSSDGEGIGEDPRGVLDRGRGRRQSLLAALGSDRGRRQARHPARVDQVEFGEIDRHVERDPVIADAALDAQAERPDLSRLGAVRIDPAAGVAVTTGGLDAVRGARGDERSLERADKRANEQATRREGQDRIRHELARTVIGDLPAALDTDHIDAAGGQVLWSRTDVRRVGSPSEGQDGWVLEEEEPVTDGTVRPFGHETLLERQCLVIIDPSEP